MIDACHALPNPHRTGKVAILYLLDQTNMGKFNSSTNNDVQEVIPVPRPIPSCWTAATMATLPSGQRAPLPGTSMPLGRTSL
jgi:hypothetical protein